MAITRKIITTAEVGRLALAEAAIKAWGTILHSVVEEEGARVIHLVVEGDTTEVAEGEVVAAPLRLAHGMGRWRRVSRVAVVRKTKTGGL